MLGVKVSPAAAAQQILISLPAGLVTGVEQPPVADGDILGPQPVER